MSKDGNRHLVVVLLFMLANKTKQLKLLKFITVGGINTVIDFGIYNLLIYKFGWWLILANVVSFSTAVTNSYFLNKYWTFQDKEKTSIIQFSKFFIVNIIGLGLSTGIVYLGESFLAIYLDNLEEVWRYNIAKVISVILVWVWNYLAYEYYIFRQPKPTGPETNSGNTHL